MAARMPPPHPPGTDETLHTLDKHPSALFQAAEAPEAKEVALLARADFGYPAQLEEGEAEPEASQQQRSCFNVKTCFYCASIRLYSS
jgi:hypothetical protein